MISKCVDKLFESLPEDLKNTKTPIEIDLILEGGAFNGSYLLGALYFLKKMEKHKIVVIKRISGVSIGSFMGFLYCIDCLDLACELYTVLLTDFKKYKHLNIIDVINNNVKNKMPNDICSKINNKLFISYTNIKKRLYKILHN
jgi:predicted acylesterase/phospholipase RssA